MKKAVSILVAFLLMIVFSPSVFAEDDNGLNEILGEINESISDSIDSDVLNILDEEKISIKNPQSVNDIKAENVIEKLIAWFTDALKKPVVMLGKIIAVSLICIVMKSMSPDKGSAAKVYNLAGILSTIVLMSDTISDSFLTLQESMENINKFMISYIPLFSSVVSAVGNVTTGGSYTAVMLLICEGMAVVSSQILIPFLSIVLAVTLVSAVNPNLQFSGIAESVKKCTVWTLSAVMSIFVGLMSLQGLTGGAVDNVASKVVKFATSSFIPVIGSSVSEAYSAVKGSLGVIRSGVGSIGIIIVFIMAVKPLLTIIAIKFMVWAGKLVNDAFGQKEISEFLKSTNSVLSIGLSIMVAYAIVFIIATAVVMMTAMNVGT
ncbi:MAG: sporulation protein [Hominimerdicola sp.]